MLSGLDGEEPPGFLQQLRQGGGRSKPTRRDQRRVIPEQTVVAAPGLGQPEAVVIAKELKHVAVLHTLVRQLLPRPGVATYGPKLQIPAAQADKLGTQVF